ncbi:MAG: DNA ligase [Clostridiales bacterium]|nr:DNA ligase [Clostridiales bacterium]
MEDKIIKYPRTPHLNGSKIQSGDEDLQQIPFEKILGKSVVIEEKVDGANAGVSFSKSGKLLLQSRGHFLVGGYRERHYDLFKLWAAERTAELYSILGTRYIMYGEWLYAKHKIYYDNLPSFFLEFDIYDKERAVFLDTSSRRALLKGSSVNSVAVLGEGVFFDKNEILKLLGKSKYSTPNSLQALKTAVQGLGLSVEEILLETDCSGLAEGLYIKVEQGGAVVDRIKFVRQSYIQPAQISTTSWLAKPIIANWLEKKV